ncbi:MAG: DeoR/GlpR family DNA-binding transcription regulator [Clostridia bacterium]|nr:DeoR/GlpR family DNA-binding transcription regulator [Clostridia bacterium]
MFAEERLEKIIESLNQNGKIIVKELSKRFNVTEDCIRKDLKNLEKQGIIKRTYGGAVLKRIAAQNSNISNRKSINIEAKRKIAEKVLSIIRPGETIFLDISTTNIVIAEKIANSKKRITVITNMIDIIRPFSYSDFVEVIGTGGVFNKELNGFVGSTTIEAIGKYKVDRAFIGSCGINLFDKSLTTFHVEDGNTKKAIIQSGKKVYLVVDSKKFYFDGTYKFADIYDVDGIILDEKPNEKICNTLEEMNVNII